MMYITSEELNCVVYIDGAHKVPLNIVDGILARLDMDIERFYRELLKEPCIPIPPSQPDTATQFYSATECIACGTVREGMVVGGAMFHASSPIVSEKSWQRGDGCPYCLPSKMR